MCLFHCCLCYQATMTVKSKLHDYIKTVCVIATSVEEAKKAISIPENYVVNECIRNPGNSPDRCYTLTLAPEGWYQTGIKNGKVEYVAPDVKYVEDESDLPPGCGDAVWIEQYSGSVYLDVPVVLRERACFKDGVPYWLTYRAPGTIMIFTNANCIQSLLEKICVSYYNSFYLSSSSMNTAFMDWYNTHIDEPLVKQTNSIFDKFNLTYVDLVALAVVKLNATTKLTIKGNWKPTSSLEVFTSVLQTLKLGKWWVETSFKELFSATDEEVDVVLGALSLK